MSNRAKRRVFGTIFVALTLCIGSGYCYVHKCNKQEEEARVELALNAEQQHEYERNICDPLCRRILGDTFLTLNNSRFDNDDCICEGRLDGAVSFSISHPVADR